MNRAHALSVAFAFGSIAVVACGGVDQPDLFGPSGSSSNAAAGNGTGGKDGGGGKDASVASDAGGGGGGGGSDAGVVVPDSGGPTTGASGIYCGSTGGTDLYCTGGKICCVRDNQGGAGVHQYACMTESDCDDAADSFGDLVIPCARKSDCHGGDSCCGTFVTASPAYYDEVTCDSDCTSEDSRVFCDSAKGNADCPTGQTCQTSGALPGFHVCGS